MVKRFDMRAIAFLLLILLGTSVGEHEKSNGDEISGAQEPEELKVEETPAAKVAEEDGGNEEETSLKTTENGAREGEAEMVVPESPGNGEKQENQETEVDTEAQHSGEGPKSRESKESEKSGEKNEEDKPEQSEKEGEKNDTEPEQGEKEERKEDAKREESEKEEAQKEQPQEKEKEEDLCELPSDAGNCKGLFNRYFYNKVTMQCEIFTYKGCGGNANNFKIKIACERKCRVRKTPQAAGNVCNMTKDAGTCDKKIKKWYFDADKVVCRQFTYGGCGGNGNRFDSREECRQRCIATLPAKVICRLPRAEGKCKGKDKRWFYDSEKKACQRFTYTGCEGNLNNFGSLAECKRKCAFV